MCLAIKALNILHFRLPGILNGKWCLFKWRRFLLLNSWFHYSTFLLHSMGCSTDPNGNRKRIYCRRVWLIQTSCCIFRIYKGWRVLRRNPGCNVFKSATLSRCEFISTSRFKALHLHGWLISAWSQNETCFANNDWVCESIIWTNPISVINC